MVTERYAHLAPENVKAAVSRLEDIESRFGHGEDNGEGETSAKLLNNWRARRDDVQDGQVPRSTRTTYREVLVSR